MGVDDMMIWVGLLGRLSLSVSLGKNVSSKQADMIWMEKTFMLLTCYGPQDGAFCTKACKGLLQCTTIQSQWHGSTSHAQQCCPVVNHQWYYFAKAIYCLSSQFMVYETSWLISWYEVPLSNKTPAGIAVIGYEGFLPNQLCNFHAGNQLQILLLLFCNWKLCKFDSQPSDWAFILIVSPSTIDKMFEIYTFCENTTEI